MANHLKSLTDQELLLCYQQQNDLAVIAELFDRYYHLVFGVTMKYTQNADDAKDISMQVFEKLIPDLKKHKIEYFKSWIYRVAQNACFMEMRKNKALTNPLDENNPGPMENHDELHLIEEKEILFENLEQEISLLPIEQQKCIILFYLKNQSYNDICCTTGYSFKEVKSFIQNGKRNLKQKLTTIT